MNLLLNLNWSHPTWDLFIVLFFGVAAFVYGLSLGRDKVLSILVSVYMALAVVNTAPYINRAAQASVSIGVGNGFFIKLTAFIALFIVLFFLLSRSALDATIVSDGGGGGGLQTILFSFLQVGLIISVVLSFLPVSATSTLAPLTLQVFTTEPARFFWIVAPIAAMVVLGRRH